MARLHLKQQRLPTNGDAVTPNPPEPDELPVEPDEGPVPAVIPDDPGHDRTIDPAGNRAGSGRRVGFQG